MRILETIKRAVRWPWTKANKQPVKPVEYLPLTGLRTVLTPVQEEKPACEVPAPTRAPVESVKTPAKSGKLHTDPAAAKRELAARLASRRKPENPWRG
jgi:hypothetical protein